MSVESLVETYAGMAPGTVCALFGSSDHLEVAEYGGSASNRLGLGAGVPVEVARPAQPVLG